MEHLSFESRVDLAYLQRNRHPRLLRAAGTTEPVRAKLFAWWPAPPERREQRKTVTVLFCDMTGSTALGERLDPEPLRMLLNRYFDRMRAIVERHGGAVDKFIGDAVVAVFGVPVVREDDAVRAVRAAAAWLADNLPDLNVGAPYVTAGDVLVGF